jgi:hypothetical protein
MVVPVTKYYLYIIYSWKVGKRKCLCRGDFSLPFEYKSARAVRRLKSPPQEAGILQ